MEFLIGLIIFGASVAIYRDAVSNEIANPIRWGVGSAFIFIIVIPIYLFKRKKIIGSAKAYALAQHNSQRQIAPSGAYFLMFIVAFIAPVWGFLKGDLPACDSRDVAVVITKLLDGAKYAAPAQVSYDRVAEVRNCNLTMSDRVFSYTVSWYSDSKDQFVVQFN
ncbi:hypothetical protein H5A46_10085 [Pectobacterium versatile]|uniref:hypothetical protein n=1 Tax=Pectobacterium versatile TaxID=2488639 RepID=UPI001969860A|nr:hypothetical protein [Pectobacterium versatile]MBN3237688.1 hypothetical protein [Pectobacterium versatile]